MRISHSKLTTILSCPKTYYLNYKQGIKLKNEKSAFAIGTAVHWGLEHNTDDLEPYYMESASAKQRLSYGKDEFMAEGMVHGFLKHKDEIYDEILTDVNDETKRYNIISTDKEIELIAQIPSVKYKSENLIHEFQGFIDLLFTVSDDNGNLGFIIIDYKTSSQVPVWEKYLDQIYRYIMLLKHNFPDMPIFKIGIVNLRKTGIRQLKKESPESYLKRIKDEYELNEEDLINTHMFEPSKLDPVLIEDYIKNLTNMIDTAETIDREQLFYINYANADGMYGKSVYYDIFYHTPSAEMLYTIRDMIYDPDEEKIVYKRDCVGIDMRTIEDNPEKIMNKYSMFKEEVSSILSEDDNSTKESIFNTIKNKYIYDESLLERYWITLEKE